ncbi:MAG: OsmC family protein [Anaerolineae bacterium]
MTEAKVSLREGYNATISVGGHTVITDEPLDVPGGQDLGPTPLGLMVGSLGSCIAVTVKLYADRKNWPLDGVDVDVSMKRFKAAEYAAYEGDEDFVHEFKVRVDLKGNLTDEQRARLMEIAGKCPVHRAIVMPAFVFDEMVEPTSV